MTKQELAKLLDGMDMRDRIPQNILNLAKENGLVIVYGASDDLIEFDGAIRDEGYVDGGDLVLFDEEGILPEWDYVDKEDEEECKRYFERKAKAKIHTINVFWGDEPYSWTYSIGCVPQVTFDILDDGEMYCQAVIFSIKDIGA